MNTKVKEVLEGIFNRFQSGDIPKAIAHSMFPIPDIPSCKWSLCNRTIMFLSGTQDARGFRQWHQANRYVKKGAKAFYILVPMIYKKDREGEERQVLCGFKLSAVFKVEDTDGEALEYQQVELPELPLFYVAEKWGISVKAIPGNYHYYGYYSDNKKEIALASQDETVFFHELAHAAHEQIKGKLTPGQDWKQEVVAELSAASLCQIVGKDGDKYLGSSFRYIADYAEKAKHSALTACLQVMGDVEKVLNLILKGGESNDTSLQQLQSQAG